MQPLFDATDRPKTQCAKCRTTVILPLKRDRKLESQFAAIVRQNSVQGVHFAETMFSLGPREAKALVLHITREAGKCHFCGKPLQTGESVCTCRSLNLDW